MKYFLRNKKVIFITGDRKGETSSVVDFVCKHNFSVLHIGSIPGVFDIPKILKNEIIIFEDNENISTGEIRNFLNALPKAVFIITQAEKKSRIKRLLLHFPERWLLVVDFSIAGKLRGKKTRKMLTFGINKKKADFFITDINQKESETNFKVNYKSNIIPFWISEKLKKKEVYSILPALCVAETLNLNLAEVSFRVKEKLKSFTNG